MKPDEAKVFDIALSYAIEDEVPIYFLYGAVKYVTGSTHHARRILDAVFDRLLSEGLVVVGNPGAGQFNPWPGEAIMAMERIRSFLDDYPLDPGMEGTGIWYILTDAGHDLAERTPDPFDGEDA
ncbi:MAG: hypothetical protein QM728_12660 [Gordonia sp. (in: high G+C Gram-positive bacteria)]|uniref:hypothetical protein n=1 Tax=Gordonia sp. (in: high G+C Gram-positive bacteria) TaxID=84139 RepID=UPI0039E2C17F